MSRPRESADRRRLIILISILGLLVAVQAGLLVLREQRERAGTLTPERARELGVAHFPDGWQEVVSDYSRILVEEMGTVRTLFFVTEDGRRSIESRMDVARPHQLLLPYSHAMFASYAFVPNPERVLIVGLGAGSMVRFLEHYDPQLHVDVVEIDPAVIDVARESFGTDSSPTVRILEVDAFDFFKTTETVYDVIYMDAFLDPSEDETDVGGVPLKLKTKAFLRDLQQRIHGDGVVVFNVHEPEDLAVIADVFPQSYVFDFLAPGEVAIAALSEERRTPDELQEVAAALDRRFNASFSFAEVVGRMRH